MKNLKAYIDNKNQWTSIFGNPGITFPLTQKSVNEIAEFLDADLSPENLHCDGEISQAQAMAKYNEYGRVITQLTKYTQTNSLNMPTIYEY